MAYVIVEGIDGSGKTTLVRELVNWMEDSGYDVDTWEEPYLTEVHDLLCRVKDLEESHPKYFEEVKTDLFAMIFSIDRMLMKPELMDQMAMGTHIIADRSWLSTMAYQYDSGFDFLNRLSVWVQQPVCVIYLDVDPKTAVARIEEREDDEDYFEREDLLKQTSENYLDIFERLSVPIHSIDANREFEAVFENAKEIVIGCTAYQRSAYDDFERQ
jgi:dTMP kinase